MTYTHQILKHSATLLALLVPSTPALAGDSGADRQVLEVCHIPLGSPKPWMMQRVDEDGTQFLEVYASRRHRKNRLMYMVDLDRSYNQRVLDDPYLAGGMRKLDSWSLNCPDNSDVNRILFEITRD